MLLLTCLLSLSTSLDHGAQDYDGKFREHPNLPAVVAAVEQVVKETPKKLPKWMMKRPPAITIELVDLEEPPEEDLWPGKIGASFDMELQRKNSTAHIRLPIDSLILDPELATFAAKRQVFGLVATAAKMEQGVTALELGELGLENPLIDAMASHWAGSLDLEIDYGLRRHLDSDEALAQLITPIEARPGEPSQVKERVPGDLTFLILMKKIAPKNDKKLGDLYKAYLRKQPLSSSLKKATRKTLDKLHPELLESYEELLEERFPSTDREAYRGLAQDFASENWASLTARYDRYQASPLTAPNAEFYGAFAVSVQSPELGLDILTDVRRTLALTPLAVQAQEQIIHVHLELEQPQQARQALKELRDFFGWLPGVREQVEEQL